MRSQLLLGLSASIALLAAGCPSPPPEAKGPAIAPSTAPVASSAPSPSAEPPEDLPVDGPPVFVGQRVSGYPSPLLLSPSGQHILVGARDGAHLVEVATGQTRGVARIGPYAAFTSDGRWVVAGWSERRSVETWDLRTDTVKTWPLPRPLLRVFPSSAERRVVLTMTGAVAVLDPKAPAPTVLEMAHPDEHLREAATSDDGWVAAAGDAFVAVWGPDGQRAHESPSPGPAPVLALSPRGRRLAVSSKDTLVVLDARTGKEASRSTPCKAGVLLLAWNDAEDELIIGCDTRDGYGDLLALSMSGGPPDLLWSVPGGATSLSARAGKIALVQGRRGDARVLPRADPERGDRFRRPANAEGTAQFSADLQRVLFANGSETSTIAVVDRAGATLGPRLRVQQADLVIREQRGKVLVLHSIGEDYHFDIESHRASLPPRGALLSPDGERLLLRTNEDAVTLVERASDKRSTLHAPGLRRANVGFSDHGRWLAAIDETAAGKQRLRLWDARTGKLAVTRTGDDVTHSLELYDWNADDSLYIANVPNVSDPVCASGAGRCTVYQVVETLSSKKLARFTTRAERDFPVFLGDKRFLLGRDVLDARTAKVAWSFPSAPYAWSPQTWRDWPLPALVPIPAGDKTLLADVATGKTLHELPYFEDYLAASPDRRHLLVLSASAITTYDTSTWSSRLVPGRCAGAISNDGALTFCAGVGIGFQRLSDGRTLHRALPDLDLDLTDEHVFDPATFPLGAALARRGPDVLRSEMAPLSLLEPRFGHPNLFADFLAGKPISPRP